VVSIIAIAATLANVSGAFILEGFWKDQTLPRCREESTLLVTPPQDRW
jgi:hypothetical protein